MMTLSRLKTAVCPRTDVDEQFHKSSKSKAWCYAAISSIVSPPPSPIPLPPPHFHLFPSDRSERSYKIERNPEVCCLAHCHGSSQCGACNFPPRP